MYGTLNVIFHHLITTWQPSVEFKLVRETWQTKKILCGRRPPQRRSFPQIVWLTPKTQPSITWNSIRKFICHHIFPVFVWGLASVKGLLIIDYDSGRELRHSDRHMGCLPLVAVVQFKNNCTRFDNIVCRFMNKPLWPCDSDKESPKTVLNPHFNLEHRQHLIICYFIIYLETVDHLGSTLPWWTNRNLMWHLEGGTLGHNIWVFQQQHALATREYHFLITA